MDISALLLPGAQNLATAMLSDAWTNTRDAIARHWGRGSRKKAEEAVAELEDSRSRALALFPDPGPDRELLVQAFIAGYLAALARTEPDRLQALAGLEPGAVPLTSPAVVGNLASGIADRVVQISGDVRGGVHM
jgi:hypothetical protein